MAFAELITIGNEILDGRVTDTNRVFLGRRLKEMGFEIPYAQSVDDNLDRVVDALHIAASRSDVIICTGGLGPTTDDLTAEAVSKFLKCPWEINTQAETFLKEIFAKRGRELNESQLKQAKLPKYCRMINNPVGTAPGFFFRGKIHSGGIGAGVIKELSLYFFPGIPKELYPMFESSVAIDFAAHSSPLKSYTWSTVFTSEGDLQQRIREIEKNIAPFRIGFRTHLPENHVTLMGRSETPEHEKLWKESQAKLDQVLAPLSFHQGTERNFEELILEKLLFKNARVLFVESCTGGLVSHLLTEVPGASQVLWGSQVCYANEEKFRLGVDPETIKKVGAVSEDCAREMAQCGLERLKEDVSATSYLVCVSTTGIAGPGGASVNKPVGLMYVGIQIFEPSAGKTLSSTHKIEAPPFLERKAMKLYMAKMALELLRVNFLSN